MKGLRLLTAYCCLFALGGSAQKLLINEVSQGITGNREFVELIVTGPVLTSCSDPINCVDIRGWIFDDNNTYFSNGVSSGTGLAAGAMRFANDPFWSCIPPGTKIVIYDVSETNTAIPTVDTDPNDGNCSLVIPITSALFDRHETQPNASNVNYPTTGWLSGGIWSVITMANGDDSFQLRDPANTSVPAHAVSWGNNTSNNFIYFAGSASGIAYQCVNTTSADFFNQSNWISVAATSQSPGAYNSTENQLAVGAMNPTCGVVFNATVNVTNNLCSNQCSGKAWISYTGGITPYGIPQWSDGQVADTARSLCDGSYSVIVSDARGCQLTLPFTIISTQSGQPIVVSSNVTVCPGTPVTLTSSVATVQWTPGNVFGASYTVTPSATTTYTATDTSSNSCNTPGTATVTLKNETVLSVGTLVNPAICGSTTGSIEVLGSNTDSGNLTWTGPSSGTRTNVSLPQTFTGLSAGTYVFHFTNNVGCPSDSLVVTLSDPGSPPKPVITASGPLSFCIGSQVILTSSAATGNVWSTGETTVSITVTTSGTFTVTNNISGCLTVSDPVTVTVYPLPPVNAGGDITVCAGNAVTLIASGALSYVWDNGVTQGVSFIPSGSLLYTVIGTDANGCSKNDQVQVTVNPLPVVNAGADQQICSSTPVTLTATGAQTFVWDNGVQDGVAFTQSAASVTYTVTGTDANGCTDNDQVTVSITSTLPLNAGADQAVCAGTAVTLTATGATGVTWDQGVVDGVAFVPTTSAIYTVSATDINGCLNTDQVAVTVNAIPVVNAGSDQQVCNGSPVNLAATGANTYVWDQGVTDGVDFIPAATATYTVTGTDINNCVATDQVVVTVNPLPVIQAGNDLSVCSGSTVTLNASGASVLFWDQGVTDGQSFVVTQTATFTVLGIDGNGCQNTDQMQITVIPIMMLPLVNTNLCAGDTIQLQTGFADSYVWNVSAGMLFLNDSTVLVFPSVNTTFTVHGFNGTCSDSSQATITVFNAASINAGTDQTVCEGDSVRLMASGSGILSWEMPGAVNGEWYQAPQSGYYTVTAQDGNCAASDSIYITLEAFPAVSFVAAPSVGCVPLTVQFINTSSGAQQYVWDFGDFQQSDSVNPIHTYTSEGWATVSLTAISPQGCQRTITQDSLIHAIEKPLAAFDPSVFELLQGQNIVSFTNHSQQATAYQWFFGDGFISQETDPVHLYNAGDQLSFTAQLIAYNTPYCSDTATVILPIVQPLIYYVPNAFTPNSDKHNEGFKPVITSGVELDSYHLLIFDRWGEVVFESRNQDEAWNGKMKHGQEAKTDIYTWKLLFRDNNGDDHAPTGFVTLIR